MEKTEEFGPILSTEKVHGATEFGEQLDIHSSKLRRWSLELEKRDYQIMRDGSNRRLYLDSDKPIFKKLRDFIEVKKIPAEESYDAVSAMYKDYRHRLSSDVNQEKTPEKSSENNGLVTFTEDQFEELIKRFGEQTEKAVQDAVNRTEKRFVEVLTNRDVVLVNSLKESMEAQKQLAASVEDEKPKGFLSKLFGK